LRVAERGQGSGQVVGVVGGAGQGVYVGAHVVGEGAGGGGDHRDAVGEGKQGVLGGGGLAVGQDEGVGRGEQGRDVGGGDVAGTQGHPGREAERGDQLLGVFGAAPELACDGQRDVRRDLGQGLEQHVEALVGANDAEEQQAARRNRRGNHGSFWPIIFAGIGGGGGYGGEVQGHLGHGDPGGGGQGAGLGGLSGGMNDGQVGGGQQCPCQRDVAGAALVREDVVADHGRAGPVVGTAAEGG
jgi:hypothetical protein